MILNPYDTTAVRAVDWKPVQKQVAAAAIASEVRSGIFRLWDNDNQRANPEHLRNYVGITQFSQPMIFNVPSTRDPLVALDFRSLKGESAYIKEQRDVLETRGALTLHCAIEGTAEDLYMTASLAAFANILIGVVAYNFGVDAKLRRQLLVVAGAHFYNITHGVNPVEGYTDTEKLKITKDVVEALKVPVDIAQTTIELLKVGSSLDTFIENIKLVDGTDRTKRLNAGLITNGSNSLWYGDNSSLNTTVAFEHAPTFAALLYAALGKGGYSRSEFAQNLRFVTMVKAKGESFTNVVKALKAEYEDGYQ